jgi:hypothetical protein
MLNDPIRRRGLNAAWITVAVGCGLAWALTCRAEGTKAPLSPMRAAAIADFSYTSIPDIRRKPPTGLSQPGANQNSVDPTVVMEPFVVRGDRGLSSQQFRAMDYNIRQQEATASKPGLSIVKVHEFKLSRHLYFAYVTILGVPVVGAFSW